MRSLNRTLESDLKRLQERDQLQRNLENKRQDLNSSTKEKLDTKLQLAISNLNDALSANKDTSHPRVLECWLHISKLSYHLGRTKDSKNILRRGLKKVNNFPDNNSLKQKYIQWQDYLNNT